MALFTKKHKNDSPTIHGLSHGAIDAHARGLLSEVELVKEIKRVYNFRISRAEVRRHITGTGRNSEWHHVTHCKRVVEMYFEELPDAEDFEDIKADILERRTWPKSCR